MVTAEIHQKSSQLIFIRFQEPGEKIENKPFIAVPSLQEATRRLYFLRRMYVISKMRSWLNQRAKAKLGHHKEINMMLSWIKEVESTSFLHVCDFIKRRRLLFESIATPSTSSCYNYYINTIVPLMDYCESELLNPENYD